MGEGPLVRRRARLEGLVQGVGMRPHLARLAAELELAGTAWNDEDGVAVEVEGPLARVEAYLHRVVEELVPPAVVERVAVSELAATGAPGFRIAASRRDGELAPSAEAGSAAVPRALVPPDWATCADCLAELADPTDRRYGYPFIACSRCGPRFTIVRGLPYDRPSTTMQRFPLCASCQAEYDDPADRRFHAQPTACPVCGPRLRFVGAGRGPAAGPSPALDPLDLARMLLAEGGILAVKGVGGYHLACDARRPDAVARLRTRKRRSAKPFALLAADLAVLRGIVRTTTEDEELLSSPAGPIVLLPARAQLPTVGAVCRAVAPGQVRLGVMLPSNGLHHLLLRPGPGPDGATPPDLVVLTSANLAGEPLCTAEAEAEQRLAGIADGWLHHDREIHLACDDSVLSAAGRAVGGGMPVRRSRGFAPLPVTLPEPCAPTLATGGELKATICLAGGDRAWLSQHLGDMASLESLALLQRTVEVMRAQARITPEVVAVDLHPGYLSRRWGLQVADELGARVVSVQHHHAHLAALLTEHGRREPALGVVFDGTGYGPDGTIWGGEFLLGTAAGVERVAHLEPVALPGGDAAIRSPARVALAHLAAAAQPWDGRLPAVSALPEPDRLVIRQMLDSGVGCVPTSSAGRLFDAVAAITGVCLSGDYEGRPAVELESAATAVGQSRVVQGAPYRFGLAADPVLRLQAAPVVAAVAADVLAGVPAAVVAQRFHDALARAVLEVAEVVRERSGVATVGLTGGVFQNELLTRHCQHLLSGAGFEVLLHRQVPPNDGGLALGQVAVAAAGGGS